MFDFDDVQNPTAEDGNGKRTIYMDREYNEGQMSRLAGWLASSASGILSSGVQNPTWVQIDKT
jgi:hypothetical protein